MDFVKLSRMFIYSTLKGQKKNLCLSAYISEITHHNHIHAYLLENYKVMFYTTRSVPISYRLKIWYCLHAVLCRPAECETQVVGTQHGQSFPS